MEDPEMIQMTGAEAMVRMLQLHGVKHIFGLCGDTSLPFYDALARLDHGMQHILNRDERSAAFMADIATTSRGRDALTELDQEALYRPLTKRSEVIDRADKLPEVAQPLQDARAPVSEWIA
jgi:acetolactate synthase-1/2/3 large subunit